MFPDVEATVKGRAIAEMDVVAHLTVMGQQRITVQAHKRNASD